MGVVNISLILALHLRSWLLHFFSTQRPREYNFPFHFRFNPSRFFSSYSSPPHRCSALIVEIFGRTKLALCSCSSGTGSESPSTATGAASRCLFQRATSPPLCNAGFVVFVIFVGNPCLLLRLSTVKEVFTCSNCLLSQNKIYIALHLSRCTLIESIKL